MQIRYILSLAALASAACFAQQPGQPAAPATPGMPASHQPMLQNPPPAGVQPITLPPEAVVLTIGSEKITRAQFEELVKALSDSGRMQNTPQARKQLAQQFAQLHVLALEARKRKLDQSPAAKQMMEIQVDQFLASELAKQVQDSQKIDEAQLKAYYDQHKGQYEQVKAEHILIRYKGSQVPLRTGQKDLTEEEALAKAKEVRQKIADGGDFAALAKSESDDTGTAATGGALPPFAKGQMVPEFETAAFGQEVGTVSQPVKSKFGYHIIKVVEHKTKTFDEARPDIEKQLQPQMLRDAMDQIEKQTPVTLDDTYFGK
jgi:parvulin-like peptidyl-prolyl isomerase